MLQIAVTQRAWPFPILKSSDLRVPRTDSGWLADGLFGDLVRIGPLRGDKDGPYGQMPKMDKVSWDHPPPVFKYLDLLSDQGS